MSTAEKRVRATTLPLVEGQRLSQPEFHRRYEAMPPGIRAELIDGVVYIHSPLGIDHGEASNNVGAWLAHYRLHTPGVQVLDGATTILGRKREPQPDALMRIRPEFGGQSRNKRGYVHGAPELVAEVAKATRYIDLGPKLNDYQRSGVREYLVRALDPNEVIWYVLRKRKFVELPAGTDGWYRSEVFPGLWLDPKALVANDLAGMIAALDQGLASPEHAAFVARLAAARGNP
jgi:Uma2 family endonuclease